MAGPEPTRGQVVLVTGASSGFGRATADALARAGHVVYAGMRAVADRNADVAKEMAERSSRDGVDVRAVEMDVQDQGSVDGAVAQVADEQGRLDVVVHNAGHMDALAEAYAAELIRYGIDTSIVVPGAYPTGTNHFAHASAPADEARAAEYDGAYGALRDRLTPELTRIFPDGHGVDEVAEAMVQIVGAPPGRRPFRVHIDPSHDGSEVVTVVFDRIRAEFYRRVGIEELLPAEPSL